jgi:peptide/nickel transport system permease protein
MLAYIIRRILGAIPLILLVLVINFIILHLAPGDPVFLFIQGGAGVTAEYVEQVRKMLGLDKPLGEQLLIFIINVFRGDLGFSHFYQRPVINVIAERMPITFLLVILSTLFAATAGIILGVFAGRHPYSLIDRINTVVAVFGYSIPIFWFGQLLIITFSIYLNILPTGGIPTRAMGEGSLLDWLSHLVLPVFTLGVIQLALAARITRASMLEILGMDYITSARAKGLKESIVTFKHALRNAVLPVLTVISVNFAFLFAGAMITETVFSWPGLGRMMFESLYRRDYPILMGLLIVTSTGVIVINLITDLMYAYLDPRVVYE